MNDLSGINIKGYQVLERIGSGGFGAVYRAYQSTVGREVALKIILPGYTNQPNFIRRFETEAQIIARLEHPYIVPLYDFWRDPDGAYLVMRYLRGGSLRDDLDQGPIDLETTVMLMDQLTAAITVAHRSNVIHRDIKPANILLDEDRNAYLSDFGIAKDLAFTGEVTQQGVLVGSPDYLAPEQARSEEVSPQTDIYSLGVVLYEMLVGEHPFPQLNAVERLYKHLSEPLPLITNVDTSIAAAINEVIQKATAKNPAHRYANALKLAVDFREAAGLGVSQIIDSPVELLTPREQEVLQLTISGLSNREIAEKLTIELSTVKWYLTQIYKKLNVRSRVQAVVKARELNLVFGGESTASITTGILPEPDNPYKGLQAFTAADEQNFFGRERLVDKLVARISDNGQQPRFLAVVGPSGSGKSSLVKAGLVPALWRGEVKGSDNWFIVEMMPSNRPLDELEVALMRIASDQPINIAEQLRRDANGLLRAAGILLPADQSELVLVVDQFEEVFTLVDNESERQQFFDLLYNATTAPRSRVRVVITLRADFYDRPLHYPRFGQLIQTCTETVLPLGADELERAIRLPAERVGVSFEDGLVPSIIEDVHYQPGALPLLQYALTELFEYRDNLSLTHAGYEQIGRATGALAARANEAYYVFSAEGRETIKQMFMRLVTLDENSEDTRRRVLRRELLAISDDPDLMEEVIDTFANYRLIALDYEPATRRPTVEVAHEALLREWGLLHDWLNENRADISMQRQLSRITEEWVDSDKDTSFLLRGTRLDIFESWADETSLALTGGEWDYLQVCLAAREQHQAEEQVRREREMRLERTVRQVLTGLLVVSVIAAVVSAVFAISAGRARDAEAAARQDAIVQRDEANQARDAEALAREEAQSERDKAVAAEYSARVQAGIGLAAMSEQELVGFYPERAVLLALEAAENYPYSSQTYHALSRSVYSNHLIRIIDNHTAYLRDLEFSADGARILTGSSAGMVRVTELASGEELLAIDSGLDSIWVAEWSPDETQIALTAINGKAGWIDPELGSRVGIWDAESGSHMLDLPVNGWILISWTPDGNIITSGNNSGAFTLWDASTGDIIHTFVGHDSPAQVKPTAWSPDGSRFISTDIAGGIKVWDFESRRELLSINAHNGSMYRAQYSPDGRYIATEGSDDNAVRFWDAETGEELTTFRYESDPNFVASASGLRWHPSSQYAAVYFYGEDFQMVDVETGEVVMTFPGHVRPSCFEWSPDGSYAVTGGEDGQLIVWNIDNQIEFLTLNGHRSSVNSCTWTQAGQVLSEGGDGIIHIWDIDLAPLMTQGYAFPSFGIAGGGAWSPDGTQFIRGYMDGTAAAWDAETGEAILHISGLKPYALAADWSDDNRILVIPDIFDQLLYIYNGSTGELEQEIQTGHSVDAPFAIINARFSPDGSRILTASFDKTARVFDSRSGELLLMLDSFDAGVFSAEWSPDGSEIVTGAWDTTATVWDASTGEMIRQLYPDNFAQLVTAVAWSPDGERIVTSSYDGMGVIWDIAGNQPPIYLQGHTGQTNHYSWSLDSAYVLSSNTDGTARIWDAVTGFEVSIIDVGKAVWGVHLSPDGVQIALSVEDGTARFYPFMPSIDDLISYAHECCVVRELTEKERQIFGLPGR